MMNVSFHTYPKGWPYSPVSWIDRVRPKFEYRFHWSNSLREGMRRHGTKSYVGGKLKYTKADVAVVWSWKRPAIIKDMLSSGRHVVVMERGFIQPRFEWCSLTVDGFNGRGLCAPANDQGERWERLFSHHLKPWRTGGGNYALLIGQVPQDAALQGNDIVGWAQQTADKLAALGHRVLYRPHPLCTTPCPRGAELSTGTLEEDLANADRVVTFNSTTAVEAILAGIPTVIHDAGSPAYPMASHNVAEPLVRPDRTKWCHDMAWRQWSLEDMADGTAWGHALKSLRRR